MDHHSLWSLGLGSATWPLATLWYSPPKDFGFSPVGILLVVTTALGSGAMMKSNSRRMSMTMKRYSESIKSSARQAPPKVRRETKVCHGSAICLTFLGSSFHLWSESFLGDGHFLWPGEVVRPTGWVLDIDLVQHFLKFQQTKPWALERQHFFITAAMGMPGQSPGHPAPNPEINRSMPGCLAPLGNPLVPNLLWLPVKSEIPEV